MILIADSGSSTTEWRLLDGDSISQFQCIGLNPYIVDNSIITDVISQLEIPYSSVKKLHFYGAGCASSEKSEFMLSILKSIFTNADISVHSDLLAAARSLLQNNDGIIGILGTGSNVAKYNGDIVEPFSTSMGYLLGDEGSGNALGKRLLKAYLSDYLDDDLNLKIGLDKPSILNQLYAHSFPNRYLASFAKMMFRNRNHPQIAPLIKATFDEWIEVCLLPYQITEISICGSISYYFHSELKRSCESYGISVNSVLEKPIAALTLYHKAYQ
jgi:N-acetylglucosamine kinase-like BadF-type ATPase